MKINPNKKKFNLSLVPSKTYNLIVDGFIFAVTFLFQIRFKIPISFISKIIGKMTTTINVKKIKLITLTKLRTSVTQTINERKISISYVLRQQMKAIVSIIIKHPIVFTSKARQKIISTIYQGILHLNINPTLAVFFTLGNYDPDTLGTMDTSTLGQLDYTS